MRSWRILVADDEPSVLLAFREVLSALPASVLEAQDGAEALRLAKAERPDLILLDVKMPRLNGFQVAEALKQDPATAEIPLMFISALAASHEKVHGLDLGAEDYLAKPIDPQELKARVRMVLRRARPSLPESPMAGGQLQAMNLPSLVKLFQGEERTVRLLLTRPGEQGEIVFVGGRIAQAIQGTRRGEAAVYQLLTWQEGGFQMAPHDRSSQTGGEVTAANQGLLVEGLRRLDEIPRLRGRLPGAKVPLGVPALVRSAVQQQAQSEAVALVGLLDGTRDLDQILARSPFDDWTTLKILHRLMGVGALTSAGAGVERRGGPRLTMELPIEYQNLGSFQRAATFNLSGWGVFIGTAVPFDVGERLILRFQLPGQETSLKVVGEVVWRNTDPAKSGRVGMGIRFLDLAAVDREIIERHLAQVLAVQISCAWENP